MVAMLAEESARDNLYSGVVAWYYAFGRPERARLAQRAGGPMSAVLGGECEMEMLNVTRVDNDRAMVLLQEMAGARRICCLYTDMWTGMGIAQVKRSVLTTHMHTQALLRRLLKESRVELTKVLLFHRDGSENLEARLFLEQQGREFWVDCRAADGIAQALRWKLPILMDSPSLDRAHLTAAAVPQGTGSA